MKGFLLSIFCYRWDLIFISELLRLSSIFYKIPSILLSVHRRRSSVQALREGEDGCLVHFVNIANYMSLCAMEINGSLEMNLLVNDEITVSRPTNTPSTRLWSQTLPWRVLQTNENELWKTVHPSICIYIVIYTFFNVQIGYFHFSLNSVNFDKFRDTASKTARFLKQGRKRSL